jgi:hypothetical protein
VVRIVGESSVRRTLTSQTSPLRAQSQVPIAGRGSAAGLAASARLPRKISERLRQRSALVQRAESHYQKVRTRCQEVATLSLCDTAIGIHVIIRLLPCAAPEALKSVLADLTVAARNARTAGCSAAWKCGLVTSVVGTCTSIVCTVGNSSNALRGVSSGIRSPGADVAGHARRCSAKLSMSIFDPHTTTATFIPARR